MEWFVKILEKSKCFEKIVNFYCWSIPWSLLEGNSQPMVLNMRSRMPSKPWIDVAQSTTLTHSGAAPEAEEWSSLDESCSRCWRCASFPLHRDCTGYGTPPGSRIGQRHPHLHRRVSCPLESWTATSHCTYLSKIWWWFFPFLKYNKFFGQI